MLLVSQADQANTSAAYSPFLQLLVLVDALPPPTSPGTVCVTLRICWDADDRPILSPAGVQRLTRCLSSCGTYITHCEAKHVALSMGKPDRPDSEQPPLHTVQEPVLVLTTSHLLILAQKGQKPAAVLPLQGMHILT